MNEYDEKLQEFLRWKPKISMKKVCSTINDAAEMTKKVIKNSVEDVNYFFDQTMDCVKGCGVNVDNIRLRLTHRAIQYFTSTMEILSKNNLLPAELIYYIYTLIADDISRDPKPQLFLFENPYYAIYKNEKPILKKVNPETHVPNANKKQWLFIHGMLYSAMNNDGSDFSISDLNIYDFYSTFEQEAEMFKNNESNTEIYLVSYDSEMNNRERKIIEKAIAGQVIGELGAFELIFVGAIFWREMERRARVTGDYLVPFLKTLNKSNDKGIAVTHSLGCYVLAHAGQKIHREDNMGSSFKEWWCMSAALPSDAFSNTGDFKDAIYIAQDHPGKRTGTHVWYSLSDIVLMMIYPLATYHTALGQTGAGLSRIENVLEDIDLTNITDVYHGFSGEYIKRLGPCIRNFINTDTDETC